MSSLHCGAFSPKAWLFIGDVKQRPPFVTTEHDLESKISSSPFFGQYRMSTLNRAVDPGASTSWS